MPTVTVAPPIREPAPSPRTPPFTAPGPPGDPAWAGRRHPGAARHDPLDGVEPLGPHLLARLVALCIDVGAIGLFIAATLCYRFSGAQAAAASGVPYVNLALPDSPANSPQLYDAYLLGAAAGVFLYLCVMEAVAGTTLGKLLFGLHVVRARDDGGRRRLGFARAFVRNAVLPIDAILIGPLLAATTARRRRLGDLVGGTVVERRHGLGRTVGLVIALAAFAGIGGVQWSLCGRADAVWSFTTLTARFAPGIARTLHDGLSGHVAPMHAAPAQPGAS